jgi:pyroglutamyl-peptidase
VTDARPVILCGFEPFGGRRRNRSWDAVSRVPDRGRLERAVLPVDFAALARTVPALVARDPELLIMVGEDGGRRRGLALERVALNVAHAEIPDNRGQAPQAEALAPGGDAPLAYPASWDAPAIVARLLLAGIAAEVSHHAGTFACNAALYLALHAAAGMQATTTIGFVHVPGKDWPVGPTTAALAHAIDTCILTALVGKCI